MHCIPFPLNQFSASVSTSLFKENLVPDKCLKLRLGAKSGLKGRVVPDFPLELLQQFLSFASNMVIGTQEDGLTQHARAFPSDSFTVAQWLHPFSEVEGIHIWNKVLFRHDVKTDAKNWLNGQGCNLYQAR
ncbi:hypothetical protein AVEN_73877-1 [Araneus ventricosus]|uniref:Uncharacterized protein n=1 Tax=Araneus ventricosus TaxID=182803 RepID=A0A4Y2FXY4_ARAVE|nr:hypothetical protein AVEN_73877-1 [Araneus ventricosus]